MPLPIRWTARAEPPKKRAERGPGRPRKIQRETEVEIDLESDESDGDTGEKTKHLYTLKLVVAVERQESITAASVVGYQIRWYTW